MDANEYVLGLLAIITGLAMADLLTSLHHLMVAQTRVKWDWLALMAAAAVTLVLVSSWWIAWAALAPRPDYNPPLWLFSLTLIQLGAIYLAIRAVLPDGVSPTGVDLADYYADRSGYVWRALVVTNIGYFITEAVDEWTLLSSRPMDWIRLESPFMAEFLCFIVLGTIRSRRVHAVLVPLYLVAAALWLLPLPMSG